MLNSLLYILTVIAFVIAGAVITFTTRKIQKLQTTIRLQQNDLRHVQQDMARMTQQTVDADMAKNDFLANTSHEIRTPMTAILGMTRLLLDTELSAEQRSWAEIVRDSGENLLAIINDILDLSKMEADKMSLTKEAFDLCRIMAEATDLVIHKAEQKNIALIVDISPVVPRWLTGDVLRIKQIATNLLGNAVKFTNAGHIKLTIQPDQENSGHIVFRVADTGIGIAPEKLRYVFDKFAQAEESTTRQFGGTGLGLAITHKLVKLMGGNMCAESTPQQGSDFCCTIPLDAAPHAPDAKRQMLDASILILADYPVTAAAIKNYAQDLGLSATTCAYATEVIGLLHATANENKPYNYLLIDHCMGGARILELVERIHIFPEFSDIKIIAVTTLGFASTSRLLNCNKISALLTRPLFPDHLEETLHLLQNPCATPKLITRGSIEKSRHQSTVTATRSYHGTSILVVEDIEVNQMLMAKILEKFGCTVDAALSGKQALQKLQAQHYDLIFMDGHMPEMDGLETTRRIRQMESQTGQHHIIIALTADAMSGDAEKYLAAGMNDYMNKPITPERINTMLGKWITT